VTLSKQLANDKPFLFTTLILLVPLAITFFIYQLTLAKVNESHSAKFDTLIAASEKALEYRMHSYYQALLGGIGFYNGSEKITRKEWRDYVATLNIEHNFHGINGIGVIEDIPTENLNKFIKAARVDNSPNFTITPQGSHKDNYIIKYIEPENTNLKAIGLNIGFEANRKNAANKARDSGKAAITQRILLVQDSKKTPGFLLLLPSYSKNTTLNTLTERRKHFKRWIYAPFIAKNFMKELTPEQSKLFNLAIFDGSEENASQLIYNTQDYDSNTFTPKFKKSKTIQIMQQDWHLTWTSTEVFEISEKNNEPIIVLISGIIFTGMLAFFALVMSVNAGTTHNIKFGQYIVPTIAFCLTALASYYLYVEISKKERDFINNSINEAALSISSTVQQNINSQFLALERMADRWAITKGTPLNQWRADANNYIKDQPGLTTIEWIDETYHVQIVEPSKNNENIVGLNILYDQKREDALKGAALKKQITITPPMDLIQGYKAFIAYSPVRIDNQFKGFIAGIYNLEDLLSNTILNEIQSDFAVKISYNGKVFYTNSSSKALTSNNKWVTHKTLQIADKFWQITISPQQHYINDNTTLLPFLILATGIVLSLMVALVFDFAQRTHAHAFLASEKENLLSTFVKHVPVAVAMLDRNLNYVAASDRWYTEYNIAGQELIGKNHYEIFPESMGKQPEWLGMYQKVLEGEIVTVPEKKYLRADGSEEWTRYEVRPWHNSLNSEINGLIMFTENITHRKHLDGIKDEFISTVNHELRTPLTSIKGSLGLLKYKLADTLDKKTDRLLNVAYDNCIHLAHLVNDILDMEKIAAGKMTYDIQRTELIELIRTTVEHHQSFATKYDVELIFETDINTAYSFVDPGRLSQALINLVSNAAKFSPPEERVIISTIRLDNYKIKVAIQDNGPGISEQFRSQIFGKFAQADSSNTRAKGGTGLGLNITQSIITAFNGEINYHSEEGSGSTFYFILPLDLAPHSIT